MISTRIDSPDRGRSPTLDLLQAQYAAVAIIRALLVVETTS